MRVQNQKEINQAFGRFLAWFASLTVLLLLCVYFFLRTSTYQVNALTEQRQQLDEVFLTDAILAEKVDTLYSDLSMLNTERIRNDRQMQRVITRQKEELAKLVAEKQAQQDHFGVYSRLIGHVNEMLVLKDSLSQAATDEATARAELTDCLNYKIRR